MPRNRRFWKRTNPHSIILVMTIETHEIGRRGVETAGNEDVVLNCYIVHVMRLRLHTDDFTSISRHGLPGRRWRMPARTTTFECRNVAS